MEIKLSGSKEGIILVSEKDYDELSKYKWYQNNDGYAKANIGKIPMLMHRYIMPVTDENQLIDHINNDKLDNRRENLRITSSLTNSQNKKIYSTKKTSIYRGVFYLKTIKKFRVETVVNGQKINMGTYLSEIEAAEVFDMYLVYIKKDYSKLNFPEKLNEYLKKEYIPYQKKNRKICNYIGVRRSRYSYYTNINLNGKTICPKFSKNELDCALAYDKYIVENNIPNRKLNFSENHPNYNPKSVIKTNFKSTNNENIIQLIIKEKPDTVVLINKSDYNKVKNYKININSNGYVIIYIGGNKKSAKLSRYLLGITNPSIWADHIDSNRLNNCRNNLRLSDSIKNSRNRSKSVKKTASKYFGTFFRKLYGTWIASFNYNYETIRITTSHSEIHAARARDLYILIHYPDEPFKLNFKWSPTDIEKWKSKLITPKNFHKWIPQSSEEKILEKTSRIVQNLSSGNDLMVEKLLSLEKRNSKFKAMEQFNWLNSHNTPKQSTLEISAKIANLLSSNNLLEVEKLLLVQKENTKSCLEKLIF